MQKLDPQLLAIVNSSPAAYGPPKLDSDLQKTLDVESSMQKERRRHYKEKYAWNLAADLSGERSKFANAALKEIDSQEDRQWLIGEVAKISKAKDWKRRKDFHESGYIKQRGEIAKQVGGAFADAGTGMVESAVNLAKITFGKGKSPEDISFLRDMEAAKQGADTSEGGDPMTLKALTGAVGMVPDVAAGSLATIGAGPTGGAAYWTARGYGDLRDDFREMGLSSSEAALAGGGTAAVTGALEMALNVDPTGLMKKASKPALAKVTQAAVRKAMKGATGKAGKLAVETAARVGGEIIEEGLQGSSEEAIKFIISKAHDNVEERDPLDILKEGYEQMKAAAPGMLLLGGVGGGGASIAGGKQRKQKLAMLKEVRHGRQSAIEVQQLMNEGGTPSRRQWNKWKLPQEQGQTKKDRKVWMEGMAEKFALLAAEKAQVIAKQQQTDLAKAESAKEEEKSRKRPVLISKDISQQSAVAPAQQQQQDELVQAEVVPEVQAEAKLDQELEAIVRADAQPIAKKKTVSRPVMKADVKADVRQERPVARKVMQTKQTGKALGRREVVRELDKIWGNITRTGRTRMRSSAGEFDPGSFISRLKGGTEDNFETTVHETAHFLDASSDILRSAPANVRAEVAKLDYDTKKTRDYEGFAEFIRGYVTDSGNVKAKAPKFHAYLENYMKQNPEVAKKFEASRALIKRLDEAGAVGRTEGQISKTGKDEISKIEPKKFITNATQFLYRKFKDQIEASKRFSDEAIKKGWERKKGETRRSTSHELLVAFKQAGPHMAARALEDGVFLMTGQQEKIGPSMVDSLKEIGDDADYQKFVTWMYARHAMEVWDKTGKNPGITRRDAEITFRELQDARYERSADKLTEFNNSLITMLADAGVIDGKTAKKIIEAYEHYIPLNRARKSIFKSGSSSKLVDVGSPVKGRKGSGLQIIDPVQSTLSRAAKMYEQAAMQLIVQRMHEQAVETKDMGKWYEPVKPKVAAAHFKFEEIKSQLEASLVESGMADEHVDLMIGAMDEASAFQTLSVFRPDYMSKDGKPIFRISRNGKAELIHLDEGLAEALGALNTQLDLDFLTATARGFTTAVKFGATRANPSFILSNASRDYQAFLMQGEKGLKGAFDPAMYASAYIASELQRAAGEKGDPLVRLYQRQGGELSTRLGLTQGRLRGSIKRLRAGKQGKAETALSITGASEVASRIAEFSAILEKNGWLERAKNGETPPMEVLVDAINSAHDVTVDFRRLGTWGRKLNYYIPFINAQMEGLDKTIRTFKDHPGRTAMRVAMQRVPLALLYWWYRHDDDDYKERPDYLDGYYVLTDEKGKPYWKIARPHEWGLIDAGIERVFDRLFDKDPDAMNRWIKQVGKTITPNMQPAGFTTIAETYFNYDTFKGRKIVPERMAGLQGRDQRFDYNTNLAKGVSDFLHEVSGGEVSLSPAKMEHLVNGLTGGLYSRVFSVADKATSGEDWKLSDTPGMKGVTFRKEYTSSVNEYYDARTELDKTHESAKLRDSEHKSSKERQAYHYTGQLMTDMTGAARTLSASDREKVDAALTGLARATMGKEPLKRYVSPFSPSSDLPQAIKDVVAKHLAAKASTAGRNKMSDTVRNTVYYLKLMGIKEGPVSRMLYSSLRKKKRSSESAGKTVKTFKRRM